LTEASARERGLEAVAVAPEPEAPQTEAPEGRKRGGTFRSLKYRDYRLLWIGTLFASAAQWIQQITVGWLVYELTESAFLLGAVNGFRALPLLLLAPLGGVAADRVERKTLMQATQVMLLITTAIMAAIIFVGELRLWHLFAFTLLTGVAWAFNNPVRQSIVPNLVPKHELMNALALNSAGFNVTRIIGPTIGGFMIAHMGGGENFALQAFFYVCVIMMVVPMAIPALQRSGTVVSVRENLTEGIGYVWKHATLRTQLMLAMVPVVLAFPYMALMPIFADDVLGQGASGFGLMGSAVGVGAVLGTLTLATLSNVQHKGYLLLGAIFVLGVSLILFALSRSFPLTLIVLGVTGASQMVYLTTNQTILQMIVPDNLRGRVMGIYMLSQGMMPLGGLLGGALADFTSAPAAVLVMGVLVCLMAVVFAFRAKDLRAS
jgi:MFS transporter, DHA1 family, staphyloferrin A biosynthesis exporter